VFIAAFGYLPHQYPRIAMVRLVKIAHNVTIAGICALE